MFVQYQKKNQSAKNKSSISLLCSQIQMLALVRQRLISKYITFKLETNAISFCTTSILNHPLKICFNVTINVNVIIYDYIMINTSKKCKLKVIQTKCVTLSAHMLTQQGYINFTAFQTTHYFIKVIESLQQICSKWGSLQVCYDTLQLVHKRLH